MFRHRLWKAFIICVIFISSCRAHAETLPACDTTCIDARDLEIHEQTTENGAHSYSIPAAKTDAELYKCEETMASHICKNGGTVACDETMNYPQFRLLDNHYGDEAEKNIKLINTQIKKMAKTNSCGVEFSSVNFEATRIYARGPLISIVIENMSYPRGVGGSCHGNFDTLAFNAERGSAPLSLDEIIKKEDYPALKDVLLRELKETNHDNFESDKSAGSEKAILHEADEYLSSQAWKNGFFIEHGKVQINIGEFLFSCADGNFNPVEVPDKYLKPDFLTVLEKARTHG